MMEEKESKPEGLPPESGQVEAGRGGLDVQVVKRGGTGLRIMIGLTFVIATLGLGVAGYLFYRVEVNARLSSVDMGAKLSLQGERIENIRNSGAALEREMEKLKQELTAGLEKRDQADKTEEQRSIEANRQLKSDLAAQQESLSTLAEGVGRLRSTVNGRRHQWQLEEIKQLLILGNQRLRLAADVSGAIAALDLADGQIHSLGDPGLIPVRQQIATELTALKALPAIDVEGAALRLIQLSDQVEGLPLLNLEQSTQKPTADALELQSQSGWIKAGKNLWQDMRQLVRIEKTPKTRRPLLSPQRRSYLREHISLQLESARLALLQSEPGIYAQSLGRVTLWIETYFPLQKKRVADFHQEVGLLAELPVVNDLPEISGSLGLLRQTMEAP